MWLLKTFGWNELLQLPVKSWWGLLIALTLLVALIWWIIRLVARVNEDTDPAEADRQMLMAIHELHREGDLDNEEFRSIKSQIVVRLTSEDSSPEDSRKAAKPASAKSADQAKLKQPKTDDDEQTDDEIETN